MTNEQLEELMKTAIGTSTGGQLNDEQRLSFIDTVIEEGQDVYSRIEVIDNITASKYDFDVMSLASRLLRKGIEGTAPTETFAPTIERRDLQPQEIILPYDVTDRFMKRNIERGNVDAALQSLFAKKVSNDLVDLAFNGDTDASGADEDFLKIFNGYIKRILAGTNTHKLSKSDSDPMIDIFAAMLKELPSKWKRDSSQLFYAVSPANYEKYQDELSDRNSNLGDMMTVSKPKLSFRAIDLLAVPSLPDTEVILTANGNLAIGIGQEISDEIERDSRARVTMHTITMYADANYQIGDAIVIASENYAP